MSLKREFVRDGYGHIIGSITTGFSGAFDTIVRDRSGHYLGKTSEHFHTTRDEHGNLVSINTPDPGLLIKGKQQP